MRYLTQATTILVVFCLMTTSFASAQPSPQQKVQTFTISGNVGLSGVVMKGLPGNPVTDNRGFYSVTVEYGWDGTIKPTKEGFTFVPASRKYTNVIADQTDEDYTSEIITFTISGKVGIPGVIMHGLPRKPVTDERGYYTSTLFYGWSGTVTPIKEGYSFEPHSLPYSKVISNLENQNYTAKIITFTISGQAGIPGVLMQGLPGNPVTDNRGYYASKVDYGWAGKVEPAKEGYTFSPHYLSYEKVIEDQKNRNYTAELITLTISDSVIVGGTPIPGVRVSANNGGQPSVTDSRGRFNVKVPYGWSGEITLEKKGLMFNPPSRSFTNVTTNIIDDQPEQPLRVADMMYDDMMDPYGGQQPRAIASDRRRGRSGGRSTDYRTAIASTASRRVLVVPAEEVNPKDLAEIIEDMQVMSHILDERFKETRRVQGVFTDFGDFFGRDNRQTEATYLQGYGVLFSMEVNFAFSPPLKQQQQAEQTTEPVDSTWERAKQQVFSPGDSRGAGDTDSAEEYNSQMVEELKRDLITTLKHAANIRGVQPDEWVILTVIGGGRQGGAGFGGGGFMMGGMGGMYGGSSYGGTSSGGMGGLRGGYSVSGGYGGGMAGGMSGGGFGGGMGGLGGMGGGGLSRGMGGIGGTDVSQTTVLTIRAKKSHIDAYAQDEQIFEQFRQKVQIFTY